MNAKKIAANEIAERPHEGLRAGRRGTRQTLMPANSAPTAAREPRYLSDARDQEREPEDRQEERLIRSAEEQQQAEADFHPERDHEQEGDRPDRRGGRDEGHAGARADQDGRQGFGR